jgi:hypothetical protein
LKTARGSTLPRGFESHPFRQTALLLLAFITYNSGDPRRGLETAVGSFCRSGAYLGQGPVRKNSCRAVSGPRRGVPGGPEGPDHLIAVPIPPVSPTAGLPRDRPIGKPQGSRARRKTRHPACRHCAPDLSGKMPYIPGMGIMAPKTVPAGENTAGLNPDGTLAIGTPEQMRVLKDYWERSAAAFERGEEFDEPIPTVKPMAGTARLRGSRPMIVLLSTILLVLATAASAQTTFRNANGQITGTVSTDSNGTKTFRDSSGRTTGTATRDSNGTTTFRDAGGRTTGTATAPRR